MNKEILGSIAYLNSIEVDNLLASLEGGLIEQLVEKKADSNIKKGEGSIGISTSSLGAGIESIKEEASEAIKKTTPASRLAALRKILIENKYIRQIDTINIDERAEFIEGELVEIYGNVNLSAFVGLIDIAVEVNIVTTQFSGLFGDTIRIDSKTKQIIEYLEYIRSKGVPIQILCAKSPTAIGDFDFESILIPDYIKVKNDDLTGTFNIIGRVQQVLERNDVKDLYELIPGMTKIPRKNFKALVKKLTSKSKSEGNIKITERDLRIKYPTIVISPIAMFS